MVSPANLTDEAETGPLALLVLVVVWVASWLQPPTRTVRFLGFLTITSVIYLALTLLVQPHPLRLAAFVPVWAAAWLEPAALRLGHLTREEERFAHALRPLFERLARVADASEYVAIAQDLASLQPPSADWARVRDLLLDHARERLTHASRWYLPDRWRLDRAVDQWDRLTLKRVIAARRKQTSAEFDAELAELLRGIDPPAADEGGSQFQGPGDYRARLQAAITDLRSLSAPTQPWAIVQRELAAVLEEDLKMWDQEGRAARPVDDPAIDRLQRLWLAARQP